MDTNLAKRMIEAADAEGLPDDHPMRTKAAKFEEAAKGYFSEPQTVSAPSFLGAFARARKEWCDYSGEPLV